MDLTPLIGAISVVVVAAVTGAVTYFVAKRAKSGQINTSEAATLWDEGTKMRVELRDEVSLLKGQLAEAITAVSELNSQIKASRAETESAREETRLAREETRLSREETAQLMEQVESLHAEVRTSNALTMGALADNTETRRILDLPKGERTAVEFEHLRSVGERQPDGEHPIVAAGELADGDIPQPQKETFDE